MQEVENKELSDGADARIYELGYLLVPTVASEDVSAVHGGLQELIARTFKGSIISDEMPKNITLAYPMQKVTANVRSKFSTAYFGWIKFAMDSEQVLELKKHLDLDPNVLRFLILKTVKENTIASKRFIRGDVVHRRPLVKKTETEEAALPINKEEVDKEIDALVAL